MDGQKDGHSKIMTNMKAKRDVKGREEKICIRNYKSKKKTLQKIQYIWQPTQMFLVTYIHIYNWAKL